jgi:hypothetical protein
MHLLVVRLSTAVYVFLASSFPLNEDETSIDTTPSFLEPSTSHHVLSAIEQLHFEIIMNIVSHCPFPSVLSLSSTSRHLRSKYLGSSSDRDYFASLWIKTSAPWYEVHLPKDRVCQRAEVAYDCQKMGWGYLMRCHASGSMMNRKRIWGIGQRLELKANEIGIWRRGRLVVIFAGFIIRVSFVVQFYVKLE